MKNENPWNLTEREQQALDLWCIHGNQTEASKAMGLSPSAVSVMLVRIVGKMKASHNVHALLMWDRFAFGREQGAA